MQIVLYFQYDVQPAVGRDTIFSGPGDLRNGTQGPKLACTVHVRTVASSLGVYPCPHAFRAWVCVSNRMEWAIKFFKKNVYIIFP